MLPLLLCVMFADPAVEPTGKAELRLEFSAKKFDPMKPGEETVKGVIVNNTGKPIQVPMYYDGRTAQLVAQPRGGPFGRWETRLFVRSPLARKTVEVKPSARHVIFELKLADILRTNRDGKQPFGWSWVARSAPPPSPAVSRAGEVFPGKIKFVLRFGETATKAESPPAELEIVTGKKK
jgi:hypothetical protein